MKINERIAIVPHNLTPPQEAYWNKRNAKTNKIAYYVIAFANDQSVSCTLREPFEIRLDEWTTSQAIAIDVYSLRPGQLVRLKGIQDVISRIEYKELEGELA